MTNLAFYFLNCIHFYEKSTEISCNFDIYKFVKMRYNISRNKGFGHAAGLLSIAQWLLFEAEYQSYDITSPSQSRLCFFIFCPFFEQISKKYRIYDRNML